MKALWLQLLIALFLGYLLVEWMLSKLAKQPANKHTSKVWRETWYWPLFAAFLHTAMVYLLIAAWTLWWLPLTVFAFHVATGYILHKGGQPRRLPFQITVHGEQIFLRILLFLAVCVLGYGTPQGLNSFPVISSSILTLLLALILLLPIGGRLIGFIMAPFQAEMEVFRKKKQSANLVTQNDQVAKPGLLQQIGQQLLCQKPDNLPQVQKLAILPVQNGFENGGKVIGYLERLLIFVFIAMGQYAGIGFLVAAKSIFRFGEFKDSENRMEAEYIIIGTFLSFLYAIVISMFTIWLLH